MAARNNEYENIALENINPEIVSQRKIPQPQSKLIMGLMYDLYK